MRVARFICKCEGTTGTLVKFCKRLVATLSNIEGVLLNNLFWIEFIDGNWKLNIDGCPNICGDPVVVVVVALVMLGEYGMFWRALED